MLSISPLPCVVLVSFIPFCAPLRQNVLYLIQSHSFYPLSLSFFLTAALLSSSSSSLQHQLSILQCVSNMIAKAPSPLLASHPSVAAFPPAVLAALTRAVIGLKEQRVEGEEKKRELAQVIGLAARTVALIVRALEAR